MLFGLEQIPSSQAFIKFEELCGLCESPIKHESDIRLALKQYPHFIDKQHPETGLTPLMLCVNDPQNLCSIDLFKEMLSLSKNPNKVDRKGFAIIHYLASSGATEHLSCLVEKQGVDLDIQRGNRFSAVYIAAYKGQTKALALLIQHQADVDRGDPTNGRRPLHVACFKGHQYCVNLLLAAGARIDLLDLAQRNAIHYLAQCNDEDASSEVKHAIFRSLLEAGIDESPKAKNNQSATDMALKLGYKNDYLSSMPVKSLQLLVLKHLRDSRMHENEVKSLPSDLIERLENMSLSVGKSRTNKDSNL